MNIRRLLDIIVPRFITEDVALEFNGDHYIIVCCMDDVWPGESFDAIGTMQTFNFFGFGLFPKHIGEVRPWAGR